MPDMKNNDNFLIKSWENKVKSVFPSLNFFNIIIVEKYFKYEIYVIVKHKDIDVYTKITFNQTHKIDLDFLSMQINSSLSYIDEVLGCNIVYNAFLIDQLRIKHYIKNNGFSQTNLKVFSEVIDIVSKLSTPQSLTHAFDTYKNTLSLDITYILNNYNTINLKSFIKNSLNTNKVLTHE